MSTRKKSNAKKPTTMRMAKDLMAAATKKSQRLGLSRTQYVEHLIRQDLGREAIDTSAAPALGTVFE